MTLGSTSSSDILKHIKELYEKLQTFQIKNSEESQKLFENTLNEIEELSKGELSGISDYAFYLRKLAFDHFQSVNYKEAEYYTQLLFDSPSSDKYTEPDTYTSAANITSVKQAIEYNKNLYKLLGDFNNQDTTAISYNNLGNIFLYKQDYEEALNYFERALAIFNNKNLNHLKSSVLQNISLINFNLRNYAEALKHLQDAIQLKKLFDDLQGIGFCTHLTGKTHFENNNLEEAIKSFQKAIEILIHLNDKNGLVICNVFLAKTFLKIYLKDSEENKNFKEAKKYLLTALNLAQGGESKTNLLYVYKNFGELYEAKENFKKANEYYKKCSELESTIRHENFTSAENEFKKELTYRNEKYNLELNKLYESELQEITKILQTKEKQRSDFVGNIVHDLKNPVGNIKQLIEYLINGGELSEEDKNDFMKLIQESADTSLALITKLLDNTAIAQAQTIIPKSVSYDIVEEINDVIKFYTIQTINKTLTIKLKYDLEETKIFLDKEILRHILDNLISNAIKFSPKGKSIFINLSKENNFLKIEVKDEGPGFSTEDKEKLFKQYSKLSARPTAGEHSSGLGLSIVKKLIDALHGTIDCESEKGKGANMIIRIPINFPNSQK